MGCQVHTVRLLQAAYSTHTQELGASGQRANKPAFPTPMVLACHLTLAVLLNARLQELGRLRGENRADLLASLRGLAAAQVGLKAWSVVLLAHLHMPSHTPCSCSS